ncbi:MAG: aldehyde dehydrogenase family protein [Nitrospira sp. CR2.1]|nr:aldehyde dehydrogenase family protein [Nitrospira sp. CR2.1]
MTTAELFRSLGLSQDQPGGCLSSPAWTVTAGAGVVASRNPANGTVLGHVSGCSDADYTLFLDSLCQRQASWSQVPAPKRGEVIRLIGQALRERKDALGTLVSLEVGKIKAEGDGEVQEMIDMADFAVGLSRMLYGQTMHSERPRHRMYEQWHPLGVVGVITAFNFPVAVWAWNAFIAAVAGNTVLWKPSPKAPLCALAVQHLCSRVLEDAGYPGVFQLLTTDRIDLADRMIRDERLPLISFTGSVPVGRHVAEVVGRRLGRSLLELSGNNAVIVDETADLELTARAILFGAVGTAGQRCTSTRRVIVHESQYEQLVSRLRAAYAQVRIGDPLAPEVLMGPLIDARAVARYQAALKAVILAGGEILFGGHVLPGPGHFVEPTIVRAQHDWDIVQQETFAPILYVMTFRTLDEAIYMHNAVPQGLSSALFTQHLRHSETFLSAIGSDCGIANINLGTSGAEIGAAFGGEKATGGGREAGSDAWKAYMRRQTTTINWGTELPLAQGVTFGRAEGGDDGASH